MIILIVSLEDIQYPFQGHSPGSFYHNVLGGYSVFYKVILKIPEGPESFDVLRAMGVPFTAAHGSIRFSLSRYTTDAEIDYVLEHESMRDDGGAGIDEDLAGAAAEVTVLGPDGEPLPGANVRAKNDP